MRLAKAPVHGRGQRLQQKAKATAPPLHKEIASTSTAAAPSSSAAASAASLAPPQFAYAPGEAGKVARHFVEKAKHPVLVVQDPKGLHKPICHSFEPRHGRSTWPVLMIGHPDDVPSGPLVSSEAAIFDRKQREKKQAAAEADPKVAAEQRKKEDAREEKRVAEREARKEAKRGRRSKREEAEESAVWAQVDELFSLVQEDARRSRAKREAANAPGHQPASLEDGGGQPSPTQPMPWPPPPPA